jgi:hypothetical protein
VLFVGGTPHLEYTAFNTVEAFDPVKKEFQLLRSCKYNHAYHSATLLPVRSSYKLICDESKKSI